MRRRVAVILLATLQPGISSAAGAGGAFHGDWLINQIDGEKPAGLRIVTMRIASDGQIAGHAPCNGFRARFHLSGGRVDFTPGMTTRMFCGAELMRQEQRFLSIFAGGAKWRVTGDRLGLESDAGVSIKASRQ
jgi:heat shock protein HslJ